MDTTGRLHFHFSLSCIGEGNGSPLQCSCLENPRDRGAWWAAVYGVTHSRTRLKRLSSSSSIESLGTKIKKDTGLILSFLLLLLLLLLLFFFFTFLNVKIILSSGPCKNRPQNHGHLPIPFYLSVMFFINSSEHDLHLNQHGLLFSSPLQVSSSASTPCLLFYQYSPFPHSYT